MPDEKPKKVRWGDTIPGEELQSSAPIGYELPEDATAEEHQAFIDQVEKTAPITMDRSSSTLKTRYKELARMIAMGKRNKEVCEALAFAPSRVSMLLKRPEIQAEIARYRDKLYDQDLIAAIKDIGPEAVSVIETMVRDGAKLSDRVDAAKWVLEKLTGKAKQEHAVESATLTSFIELAKQLAEKPGRKVELPMLDVTPSGVAGQETGVTGEDPSNLDKYSALIRDV